MRESFRDEGSDLPMTAEAAASPPRRGERRRAARLAAVQTLYDIDISGHSAIQAVDSFRRRGATADLDGEEIPVDEAFYTEIVKGVTAGRADLDEMIGAALSRGRTVAGLQSVQRAILRAGAYEMARRGDIDPPVVISEYLTVAAAFYESAETGFVNAVLDRLAQVLRGDLPDPDGA
jgi:N utilization substance protein B